MLLAGPFMTLFAAYLPIVLLIYWMTRKNSLPSSKALPRTALLTYGLMLMVFERAPVDVHAMVLKGLLDAWTPILIIAGAIFLFQTMEVTGALWVIQRNLAKVSGHSVAQVMIVGWAFPFLIEGASGFGTPAAIAAPILVGLGYPAMRVAMLCLVMNSIPVPFGAVGTPTWYGFSSLNLSAEEILTIGSLSTWLNAAASLVIPPLALLFVLKPATVRQNLPFILASVLFCVIPYVAISRISLEFPSLIGGGVGLMLTIVLASTGRGLSKEPVQLQEPLIERRAIPPSGPEADLPLWKATFPLWGTVGLLIVTRIPELGLKGWLTDSTPAFGIPLGSLGELSVSRGGVIMLNHLFGTEASFNHKLLYVPSLLPFGLSALLTFWICGSNRMALRATADTTLSRMKGPAVALLGALVFVNLMMMGGDDSAVKVIGTHLAELTGSSWTFFAAFLGALGSFFSGSNTISNLTFGGIQDSLAVQLGLERTSILALQSVGGAFGNMVCINNIVAVASVLGLEACEGKVLIRTFRCMLIYGLLIGVLAVVFL